MPPVTGYVPREFEALDETRPPDLKEAFNVPGSSSREATACVWPDALDPLREPCSRMARRLYELSEAVLRSLAAGLGWPSDAFAGVHRPQDQTLRLLHYFPQEELGDDRQLGAGPHSDHGSLTLIVQDDASGLETRGSDGVWRAVPPSPAEVLLNCGDLLRHWTGGALPSPTHRVRATSRHRYSVAYFVIPENDALLARPMPRGNASASQRAPFTAMQFLLLRSLRRVERYYRHHRPTIALEDCPGVSRMRATIAEQLGLNGVELELRLSELERETQCYSERT